jgi:hypothetical protein
VTYISFKRKEDKLVKVDFWKEIELASINFVDFSFGLDLDF